MMALVPAKRDHDEEVDATLELIRDRVEKAQVVAGELREATRQLREDRRSHGPN